jgi:hypothetical protein
MDGAAVLGGEKQVQPFPKLYERLRQIAGYTWDESRAPVHSSYDNWYDGRSVGRNKGGS